MSSQEELMENLKKDVRALLIAAKEGLAPQELEKEYKMMIGNPMPLRTLGYQSIHGLIKDVPDVISVEHSKDGSILLKAILTESTKGIADLVARQKSSKYRTRTTSKRSQFRSYRSQFSLPRRGRIPPVLPASVKSDLRSLLAWSPVLLSEFELQFNKKFGRTFQYTRFGFYSMFEVLEAAADFVEIQQTRMGSLVRLRKQSSLGNKMQERMSINSGWKPSCSVEVHPAKLHITPVNKPPEAPSQENSLETVPVLRLPEVKIQQKPDADYYAESWKKVEEEIKFRLRSIGVGATVDPEMKEKIRFVVAQKPKGLLLSRLPTEYKDIFEEDLPFKTLGFLSVKELVGALSDILHVESRQNEPDWLLFDREKARTFQTHTKEKLPCSKFKKEELPCKELWVDSVASHSPFSSSWEEPLQDLDSTEKKYGILMPEVRVVTKVVQQFPQIIEPALIASKEEDWIPPDSFEHECLCSMPEMEEYTWVVVYVEHITSPSQFYIRLCSEETSDKLVDMMFDMRRCYSNEEVQERYRMRKKFLRTGQVCCLRTAGEVWWYRVVIHRIVSEEKVEVFYVDFGNMETVEKSHLCLLKCCFSVLSAQAVPAALMCVRPFQNTWRADAVIRFQVLCGVSPLVGLVGEYMDGVLYLFLCDTSTDKDIYFHEVLQEEGHGFICETNHYRKSLLLFNPSTLYLKPALKPIDCSTVSKQDVSCEKAISKQDFSCEDYIKKENEQNKDVTEIKTEKNEEHLEMPYLETIPVEEVWDEDWTSQSLRDQNSSGPSNSVKNISSSSITKVQETSLQQRLELEKQKTSNKTLCTTSPFRPTSEFADVQHSSSLGSVEETTVRDLSLSFQELGILGPSAELRGGQKVEIEPSRKQEHADWLKTSSSTAQTPENGFLDFSFHIETLQTSMLTQSTRKGTKDTERYEVTSNSVEDFYISLIHHTPQSSVKSVPALQNLSLEKFQQPASALSCPSDYTKDYLFTEKEREKSSSSTTQACCNSVHGETGILNVPRSSAAVTLGPSACMAMGNRLLNWTPWFKKTNM